MTRKVMRKILLLTVLGVFAFAMCAVQADAAVKMTNSKSLTMTAGTTDTLTVSTKKLAKPVQWFSSDPQVVSIDKKFGKKKSKLKITAKDKGVCTIKAKAVYKKNGKLKTKTFKCKITVDFEKPPEPEGLEDLAKDVPWDSSFDCELTGDFKEAAADFSVRMLQNVIKEDGKVNKSVNTLISPDSILTALVMAENGMKGETLAEMEQAVGNGISGSDYNKYMAALNNRVAGSKAVKYQVANSIWTSEPVENIQTDFVEINKTYHNAPFYLTPFNDEAADKINGWVYYNTDGMIKEIVSKPMSETMKMLLINAVLFEGEWLHQFGDPQSGTFHAESGDQNANMLTEMDTFDYFELNGGKAFAKPYKDPAYVFVGIEPPKSQSVDEYVASLTGKDFLNAWNSRAKQSVLIKMPEFKYEYAASLNKPLKTMGMKKAFDPSQADLGGIFKDATDMYISSVLHKTYIELDKNGTKAAAVTAVIVDKASAPGPYMEVTLDHPFVYAIADAETGLPLFIGVLRNVK